jgi:Protein of unknown function (DUF2955)
VPLPLGARRTFRLGLVTALSLAFAYGLGLQFPFFAPLFGFLLTSSAAPPPGLKGLLGLLLVVAFTLGVGLLLTPLLGKYPVSAVLIIATGLYFCAHVGLALGKTQVATLLTVGFTLIPAAGQVSYALASGLIQGLLLGIALAVVCQWIVYPFFPEDATRKTPTKPAAIGPDVARWVALRSMIIVLPPVLLAFTNPTLYMPLIMKSVLLGQQVSVVGARTAGRRLIGAIFLAGLYAILFWFALKILPNLWMFFLLMLLFALYFAAKVYSIIESRFPPSFWQEVLINLLILLGPAVEDSASGKDPYEAFAVRFTLFVVVTLYAWGAMIALESLRAYRADGAAEPVPARGGR